MNFRGLGRAIRDAAKSFRYFFLRLFLDRKALFSILLVELACLAFCLILASSFGSSLSAHQSRFDSMGEEEYASYCLSALSNAGPGSLEGSFFGLIAGTGIRPKDYFVYTGENYLDAFRIENSDAYQVICFAPAISVPPIYLLCYSLLGSPEARKAQKNAAESRIGARMFALGGIALYFALALLVICLTMLPAAAFKVPARCLLLGEDGYFFLPSSRIFAFKAADSLLLGLMLSSLCLFACWLFHNPMDSLVFGFACCLLLSSGLLVASIFDLGSGQSWTSFIPGFGKGFEAVPMGSKAMLAALGSCALSAWPVKGLQRAW